MSRPRRGVRVRATLIGSRASRGLALAIAASALWGAPAGMAKLSTGGTADDRPRLLDVTYGRQRPAGARQAFWGVRLRVRDVDGRVTHVAIAITRPRGAGAADLDGGCVPAKPVGRAETWYWPHTLRPGTYRLRVTLHSSPCDGSEGSVQARSFTRALRVAAPR